MSLAWGGSAVQSLWFQGIHVVGKYCEEKDEHDTPPKVDELIEDARHELDLGHVDIDKKSQYQ
jgi:hypothetical protein